MTVFGSEINTSKLIAVSQTTIWTTITTISGLFRLTHHQVLLLYLLKKLRIISEQLQSI